jgi:hypothetical protein
MIPPLAAASVGIRACPTEVLCDIFLQLQDGLSILNCRYVCRHFKDVIDSSVALQYAIKLDLWEYEDIINGENAHIGAAECLARLVSPSLDTSSANWRDSE